MDEKDFNMEEHEENTGAVEEQTAEFMPEEEEASSKKSLKKEKESFRPSTQCEAMRRRIIFSLIHSSADSRSVTA